MNRPSLKVFLALNLVIPLVTLVLYYGKKTLENSLSIGDLAWEIDTKFKSQLGISSIKYETRNLREKSKAVGFVNFPHGVSGSGFFISADGYFLTSYHVLPPTFCNLDFCRGFQIIRDLSPHGSAEAYTRFKVIAQSRNLDFTLIKVELPENKKVPFLSLASAFKPSTANTLKKVKILGHPFGTTLRLGKSVVTKKMEHFIELAIPVNNGFSGGPVLDFNNENVVAIFSAPRWNRDNFEVFPIFIQTPSRSIKITSIIAAINLLYPDFIEKIDLSGGTIGDLTPALLPTEDISAVNLSKLQEEISETTDIDLIRDYLVGISYFQDKQTFEVSLLRILEKLKSSPNSGYYFNKIVNTINTSNAKNGKKLRIPKTYFDFFSSPDSMTHYQGVWLKQQRIIGKLNEANCLELLGAESSQIFGREFFCLSKQTYGGDDLIDFMRGELKSTLNSKNKTTSQKQNLITLYSRRLRSILNHHELTEAQKEAAIELNDLIAKHTINPDKAYGSEFLNQLLTENSGLIGPISMNIP